MKETTISVPVAEEKAESDMGEDDREVVATVQVKKGANQSEVKLREGDDLDITDTRGNTIARVSAHRLSQR